MLNRAPTVHFFSVASLCFGIPETLKIPLVSSQNLKEKYGNNQKKQKRRTTNIERVSEVELPAPRQILHQRLLRSQRERQKGGNAPHCICPVSH